jgi:hypothetical protein
MFLQVHVSCIWLVRKYGDCIQTGVTHAHLSVWSDHSASYLCCLLFVSAFQGPCNRIVLLLLVQKPFLKGPWSVGRGRGHNFPLCLKGKHNGLPQAGCSTACSWSALFGQLACFGRLVQEAGSVFHACHAHAATHMHEALVSLPWPASAMGSGAHTPLAYGWVNVRTLQICRVLRAASYPARLIFF